MNLPIKKESSFEKIIRKTGKKPSECKCEKCKSQCQSPCLPTPYDAIKLIQNGFSNQLQVINWYSPYRKGDDVLLIAPKQQENGYCVFFQDGLCKLHNIGLKPTEGKLSHHSQNLNGFNPKKSIGISVANEWESFNKEEKYKLFHKIKE